MIEIKSDESINQMDKKKSAQGDSMDKRFQTKSKTKDYGENEDMKRDLSKKKEKDTKAPSDEGRKTDQEPDNKESEESKIGERESDERNNKEESGQSEMDQKESDHRGTDEKVNPKKFHKKRKDKKDEKIEELTDRLMRNMAEFENFRKRSEKEKSTMFEIGAKSVIEKILPVVDNLERGFDALSEEEQGAPFVKGIEQIYKQFLDTLDGIGVKPIEAVGKEFDPELHNAVMHDEDENFEENTVSQELQKGYMYKDSVVRHSMVKVSN